MSYGIGITFPVEPTKEDIKKIRRDLAYDKFGVVDGGKAKQAQEIDKPKEKVDKR